MRELHVSTQITPVELADFFNQLLPDQEIGGRPGADGAVVLYAGSDASGAQAYGGMRNAVAARVAIEVVLQQVAGMPGAQPLLTNLAEQFAGHASPRAGWLAGAAADRTGQAVPEDGGCNAGGRRPRTGAAGLRGPAR